MDRKFIMLMLLASALLWVVWHQHRQFLTLTAELEKLRLKNIDTATATATTQAVMKGTPQEQAACATQAEAYFKRWLKDASPADKSPNVGRSFSSHYEVATRSCFFEIIIQLVPVGKEFSTSKYVSDAYEGSDLADYLWISRQTKILGSEADGMQRQGPRWQRQLLRFR